MVHLRMAAAMSVTPDSEPVGHSVTTTYVPKSTAARAEETQNRHRADKDGWCTFHRTNFKTLIPFGECDPWRAAQAVIVAYDRQQGW